MSSKRITTLILAFFMVLSSHTAVFAKPRFDMLLSYEGSGTNWTIAILQIITKQPVKCADPSDSFRVNRLDIPLDMSKPCIHRIHRPQFLKDNLRYFNKNSHLLLLVRNPKEVIPRSSRVPSLEVDSKFTKMYIENLEFFDSYEGPKHILYYEDLISKPAKTIKKLLTFFNHDLKMVKVFMKNYEQHKEAVISSYCRQHKKGGKTKGDHKIYHSIQFSKSFLVNFDNQLKKLYPNLYKKYLRRYEEPELLRVN